MIMEWTILSFLVILDIMDQGLMEIIMVSILISLILLRSLLLLLGSDNIR